MRAANKKVRSHKCTSHKFLYALMLLCSCALVLSGCTNWEEKYQALNVEHQNLKGLFERERAEKDQFAQRMQKDQQTIDQLQGQIAERYRTPPEATGFGQGYDVAFDPSAGTITVTLPNAILFDPGKATLKRATSTDLNHILSVLQQKYSDKQVDVVGHTDSDTIKKSKWKDNWELSAQRALTVVRYLLERGLPKDRVRAVGRGDSQPIASNATASGKAKNRRVEIVVYMR